MRVKFDEKLDFYSYKNNFKKYEGIKSKLVYDNSRIKNPFITIAIPTYKRCSTLRETLESAINQNEYDNYEIVIVDNEAVFDNPTDTELLVSSYKNPNMRYFKNEENIGMFGNWNRCIELAQGEYVALLHDDDIIKEDFLKETIGVLIQERPDLLSISHKVIDEKKNKTTGEMIPTLRKKISINEKDFFYFHPISNIATTYKRKTLIEEGGFDENLFPVSDFFTNYKITSKYKAVKILKILGYQRHGFNESANIETKINSIFALFFFRKRIQQEKKYFAGELINRILFSESIFTSRNKVKISLITDIINSKILLFFYYLIGKILVRIIKINRYKYFQ